VEIAQGDFLHQDTLEAALQKIEKAFLVTANDPLLLMRLKMQVCSTLSSIYSTEPKGVWVFSANGELKDRIYTPEMVTNVAWGDRDYKTLYLTPHQQSLPRSPSNRWCNTKAKGNHVRISGESIKF
jgi:hypothetical protein